MSTTKVSSAHHPALSPAEVRLLLLLSRPALTDSQQQLAASLIPQVTNWPAIIDTATRKYVLTMVYQNLSALQCTPPPDDALGTMRELSIRITGDMLRRQAAFKWFHTHCVLPSKVDYAYFKGPALAARFYPNPIQRFYRDIDILVPNKWRIDLLRSARDRECRIYQHISGPSETTDLDSDNALIDFLRVNPSPHILTPQGMLVELHDQIDHGTALFDTDAVLQYAVEVGIPHHKIRVVSDNVHATFIAYHHTKHVWSKLNWLADLDAIFRHPDVDSAAVLAYAKSLRLEATVSAALELHDLAATGQHPSCLEKKSQGGELLQVCVDALSGDKELESELRRGWRMQALVFDWQGMPVPLWRRAWLGFCRFTPYYEDLRTLPGGSKLSYLRYSVALGMRLLRGAPRRIARMMQR